jgi:nucleotide-binding universal stress UspA family protein
MQLVRGAAPSVSRAHLLMNKKMRILIAYDGSDSAAAALSDLPGAGLPDDCDAIVYLADVWLPSSPSEFSRAIDARRQLAAGLSSFAPASRAVEEERALSRDAGRRFQSLFPTWEVSVEASRGLELPASELIRKAISWDADLIVIGSQNRSADAGAGLGSAFLKVVAEAACSVRVSRPAVVGDKTSVRLIVGVDGSPGSESALNIIGSRQWPEGSECLVVAPSVSILPFVRETTDALRATGLKTSIKIRDGDAHHALCEEAREWGADCIFVGPDGHFAWIDQRDSNNAVTSLAVSAPCSVEVARKRLRATASAFIPLARVANNSVAVGAG